MVAITLWGLKTNHIYLWKLVNKRMGFVDTCNKIKQLTEECNVDQLLVEDKANGSAIIDTFRYMENMPPIVPINPIGGKYSRAQAVSPFIATGVVHIPTDWSKEECKDIEWDGKEKNLQPHHMFIAQHSRFPFMKHDDMVDSETQAIARLIKLITGEEPVPQRRVLRYVKWYPDMWEDYERMTSLEQEKFIATYGAPLEWAEY
jgi:predicted phage terminase large subunit-like protein